MGLSCNLIGGYSLSLITNNSYLCVKGYEEINQNGLDLFSKAMMHSILCLHYIVNFLILTSIFILLKMHYNLLPLRNVNAYLICGTFSTFIYVCVTVGEK